MGGRRLVANVALRHPETGTVHIVAAGSPTPAWAEALIGNDELYDDEAADGPAPASQEPSAAPPKSGPGSGRDAWAAYAQASGHPAADGAGRDDIVSALQSAGIATE